MRPYRKIKGALARRCRTVIFAAARRNDGEVAFISLTQQGRERYEERKTKLNIDKL
jgi:hypothetical protein